ncbi:MAG: hypothetical protein E5299_02513 [Burkholderia gladioli]|nr:MAG: hypothetical protein E5299_02513 [Burkholderia gladioli]
MRPMRLVYELKGRADKPGGDHAHEGRRTPELLSAMIRPDADYCLCGPSYRRSAMPW